jgi:hypothetical protein
MTNRTSRPFEAETVTIAAVENGVPLLVEARDLIAAFQTMVRNKFGAELAAWVVRARSSLHMVRDR